MTNYSKNNHDPHLNLFWFYEGSPKLENNITKALINTFDSMVWEEKKHFLKAICDIEIDFEGHTQLYLQTTPNEEIIKATPIRNRLLVAFSPSGKAWGLSGIDDDDRFKIKKAVISSLTNDHPDWDDSFLLDRANDEFQIICDIIDKKPGARPDAWIVVYKNHFPEFCIAFENKLYDLNPFQLNNHCKKALFLTNNRIVYKSYDEILDFIAQIDNYIANEYTRYMFKLGYSHITNLAQLETVDDNSISTYAKIRVTQVLNEIGASSNTKATYHRGWMWKLDTNNPFNKEIGFTFDETKQKFILKLYFFTTQRNARAFYSMSFIPSLEMNLIEGCSVEKSFHFQFVGTGKNVQESYCGSWNELCSPDHYLAFWKSHSSLIKQSDCNERRKLLHAMFSEDLITRESFDNILYFSDHYHKKLNICPELGFIFEWSVKEATALDKMNKFVDDIVSKTKMIYDCFGIKETLVDSYLAR